MISINLFKDIIAYHKVNAEILEWSLFVLCGTHMVPCFE